jgi:fatty acid desaturase
MMTVTKRRVLSPHDVECFGQEIDDIKNKTLSKVGEADAKYIYRIVKAVHYTGFAGRALLFLGVFPPFWLLGTLLLALSKILENMELGHNVMHGQYDFINDPDLNGKTYEWDLVGTSDGWRHTHNYKHHTYTNIEGMDDDIGYGILRIFPEQTWQVRHFFQPFYAMLLATFFQWGVALQSFEFQSGSLKTNNSRSGTSTPMVKKMRRQFLKDYVFFPILAGPFFISVFTGNLVANLLRNLWAFMIIFCGHFTADATIFPKSVLEDESLGHWYHRQIQGSSNITGGKFFHILTGNLSHQIEHHLFPTIPAWRYAELSEQVQAVCKKYGQNYNTGSLSSQFGQVLGRIFKYALPIKT